ncbi:MAG: hypothetical protein HN341_07640 [Verrucomicrobia bacterium]|nr:hypothetical protein [Verrucomicrobiota bacterium]
MHTEERPTKRRGRLLFGGTIAVIACLVAVVVVVRKNSDEQGTRPLEVELAQHFVLAPTDGILTQILISEGEQVAGNTALVQLGSPDHGLRIRKARAAVDDARIVLADVRLSSAQGRQAGAAAPGSAAIRERAQLKRDRQAIAVQATRVRELTQAVASLQAKRVNLNSQPFGREGNRTSRATLEQELTSLQGALDVATAELRQREKDAAAKVGQTSGAARAPRADGMEVRAIKAAVEALRLREAELLEALEEEALFTTPIHAPFDGMVLRVLHPKGTYVREGQPILILMPSPSTDSADS